MLHSSCIPPGTFPHVRFCRNLLHHLPDRHLLLHQPRPRCHPGHPCISTSIQRKHKNHQEYQCTHAERALDQSSSFPPSPHHLLPSKCHPGQPRPCCAPTDSPKFNFASHEITIGCHGNPYTTIHQGFFLPLKYFGSMLAFKCQSNKRKHKCFFSHQALNRAL